MLEFNYVIKDESGIHARPAGVLVKEVQKFESDIKLTRGEKTVDLKKLFALMGMAIKKGDSISIKIDGADEEKALEKIKQIFDQEGL